MVDQLSEQEQLEAIRKWLKANGPGIIAGIVIGLAAIAGWRFWSNYERSQAEHASLLYDTLQQAIQNDDLPKAIGQASVLQDDYADSAYAVFAALQLAKAATEQGDYDTAAQRLEWVIDHSQQTDMVTIARLRLARVLIAQQQYDNALTHLKAVSDESFKSELEELKGDIYAAQGQLDQARSAYQAAQTANSGSGPFLQMKLDNLPQPQS